MKKSSAKSLLAYLELDEGVEYAVYPALGGRRRQAGAGHPEEKVRMDAYNLLITKYGYPADYIDIEYPVVIREDETPRYADIAIQSCIRGQSGHLYPAEVSEIVVPDPADMPQDVLSNAIKSIKRSHAQRRLAVIRDNIASKACDAMFPSDAVKPVIAL